jgi:hypothetical protein
MIKIREANPTHPKSCRWGCPYGGDPMRKTQTNGLCWIFFIFSASVFCRKRPFASLPYTRAHRSRPSQPANGQISAIYVKTGSFTLDMHILYLFFSHTCAQPFRFGHYLIYSESSVASSLIMAPPYSSSLPLAAESVAETDRKDDAASPMSAMLMGGEVAYIGASTHGGIYGDEVGVRKAISVGGCGTSKVAAAVSAGADWKAGPGGWKAGAAIGWNAGVVRAAGRKAVAGGGPVITIGGCLDNSRSRRAASRFFLIAARILAFFASRACSRCSRSLASACCRARWPHISGHCSAAARTVRIKTRAGTGNGKISHGQR